jgi:carboxyl-terminal processing protease
LSRFSSTTDEEFVNAFKDLKKQGMTDLVVDLQSNGGGLMNAAVELADEFLSEGKGIVYTEGKHSPRTQSNSSNEGVFEKGKLVILIDEYSASASEIVSGAIQDWDRGLIIGRRSFGKGLVQRPIPLSDGSSLKLTVSRYYTPSGRFIQKPYEDADNYSSDLIDRYNRGEMIHADSIHFPDSLKTYTLVNNRTIYGGGGIMPDVFVPIDTTRFSPMYKQLASTGLLNRFIIQYVDANRQALKKEFKTPEAFNQLFKVDDSTMEELLKLAESEKVTFTDEQKNADNTLLKKQMKAYLARDLWTSSEYYKVMWTENESLLKAVDILKDSKKYEEILKRK